MPLSQLRSGKDTPSAVGAVCGHLSQSFENGRSAPDRAGYERVRFSQVKVSGSQPPKHSQRTAKPTAFCKGNEHIAARGCMPSDFRKIGVAGAKHGENTGIVQELEAIKNEFC